MNTTRIRVTVAAAAIATTVLMPVSAGAADGDRIREGACSGRADWKMKVSRENGRLEVEYEVDANRRGQQWRVRLFHNGRRVTSDTFTTRGRSGSFTVREVEPNRARADRFRARAVRAGGGQTCVGGLRF